MPMSFLKKLGETVKETASTVSAKSADLVESGKLRLKKNQLELLIKDKKILIGDVIYTAYQQKSTPDETALAGLYADIDDYEVQISAIEEKLSRETAQPEAFQEKAPDTSANKVFCTNCGQEASTDDRFCKNCGKAL